jgi:hypothetical protein
MPERSDSIDYKVWAVDNVVYGPVDFGTLEAWVQDERVAEDTWIYQISKDIWFKASDFPQFRFTSMKKMRKMRKQDWRARLTR